MLNANQVDASVLYSSEYKNCLRLQLWWDSTWNCSFSQRRHLQTVERSSSHPQMRPDSSGIIRAIRKPRLALLPGVHGPHSWECRWCCSSSWPGPISWKSSPRVIKMQKLFLVMVLACPEKGKIFYCPPSSAKYGGSAPKAKYRKILISIGI